MGIKHHCQMAPSFCRLRRNLNRLAGGIDCRNHPWIALLVNKSCVLWNIGNDSRVRVNSAAASTANHEQRTEKNQLSKKELHSKNIRLFDRAKRICLRVFRECIPDRRRRRNATKSSHQARALETLEQRLRHLFRNAPKVRVTKDSSVRVE